MVAHHETTLDPRATICLTQLETIEYLSANSNESDLDCMDHLSFSLHFKDGRSIQLQASSAVVRNQWIHSIEESHHILRSNSLPPWI